MHILYTTQHTGHEEGFAYRNPRYFQGAEKGVERVTVTQIWPHIIDAYKAIGIDVDVQGVPQNDGELVHGITPTDQESVINLDDMDEDQLHALAKERGVKVHHASGAEKVREALREAGVK